jgi:phytanoyl-CoA hydroxylase
MESRSYFTHLSVTHILQPGTSPREGIFNTSQDPALHNGVGGSSLPSEQIKVDRLVSAHVTPNYRSFLAHPVLHKFVQDFMAWAKPVLVTRTMLRHNVPGGISTGIHYDRIFLRAGEAEFLTAWVPIGDCSPNGGGLMYLEGSSEMGKAIESDLHAPRFCHQRSVLVRLISTWRDQGNYRKMRGHLEKGKGGGLWPIMKLEM